MTEPQSEPIGANTRRTPPPSGQRVAGLLLLLPAVLAWFAYQLLPVLRTLWLSLRESSLDGAGTFVGLENFGNLPGPFFGGALVQLLLGLLTAAMAVTVGIMLGLLVRRGSIGWQRIALAVVALGLVTYAPLNLAFALYWGYGEPLGARLLLAMLPVPLMIGLLGAALARSGRLLLVIGVVTALGGAAWALQDEVSILVANPTESPAAFIYRSTFSMVDVGAGAAASTVIGALLGALGLGAGLMLLAIRPRFDLTRPARGGVAMPGAYPMSRPGTSAGSSGLGILAALGAALVLVVLVVLALPWLPHLGSGAEGLDSATSARATWSTVGRRLLEMVLTLLVTGAAALGLGYLRPFGKHSVRALLVVSPWLFVGLIPLMTGLYLRFGGLQEYSGAPFFGITVQMLAIPLLFLLTYLADGMRTARDAGARVPVGSVVGVTVLGAGIVALVRGQEVVWDIVFLYDWADSALQMVFQVLSMHFGQTIPLGLVTPVVLLVLGALVLAGAAALVPGIRLVPAGELAQQRVGYGQVDPRQAQYGRPEYGPVGYPDYGSPAGQQPQPSYPSQQPADRQPQPPNPGTWGAPHR